MSPNPTHIPESFEDLRQGFTKLAEDYAELTEKYAQIRQELQTLRRLAFGQKTERITLDSDIQTCMEGILGTEQAVLPVTVTIPEHQRKTRKARRTPEEIECLTLVHDLKDADKDCACGLRMKQVGESHTLIREFTPATCHHEDHVYPRYACEMCQAAPRASHETASPFETEGVGPGLVAQIIIAKHEDHIPLNRQEKIFERHGIILAKSHMVDIIAHAHELLKGIVEPIRQEVLAYGIVGMDETTVNVLDETLKGKSHRGYFWTMGNKNAVVYRFDRGRSGENISALLYENYSGYVVADGFSAYDSKKRPRAYTLANCWAHVRRKFFEIMKEQPIAKEAVRRIAEMYHIEFEAKQSPCPMDALAEARRTLIGPKVTSFWDWLTERYRFVLPKSSLGMAMHYALERRIHLERFLEDPRIPMDNNQAERDLRHVVVGRKNWNFAGSYEGAERLATFFTLLQSCKRVKLNPWVYLTHVFTVIEDHSSHRLDELTPSRIKALLQPSLLPPRL